MKKRNVLYVHNSADVYGASRSLVRLMKQIDRNMYQPYIVLPENGPLKGMLEETGVQVIITPSLSIITRQVFKSWRILLFFFQFPISVLKLYFIIKKRHIDIVHTNTGVILSSALSAWLARVPHVWHIRDWFQEFKSIWKYYSWYIQRFSSIIICVSTPIAHQFSKREKIRVIHNGFSLDEFQIDSVAASKDVRHKFNIADNELIIGTIGRIKFVRKGQEVLIKAARIIKQKGYSPKYLIVGEPAPGCDSHLEQMKEMCKEFNIEQDVFFVGHLSDTKPIYAALDIFVLPSAQPEPFGGVVMEAMAMGVPVIATNIGGSIEQVDDGTTGFLVSPNDEEDLAKKIEQLILQPDKRNSMSHKSIQRMKEKFSMEGMLHSFYDVYSKVLIKKI